MSCTLGSALRTIFSPIRVAALVGLCCVVTPALFAFVTEREPNNDAAHANPVSCGDTVRCATLSPPTDYDYFRFEAVAGDSLVLTTLSCEGSRTNTILVLFDARDSVLAVDDDGGEGFFSRIHAVARYSGAYVVRVMRHPAGSDSAYSLHVGCRTPPPEDYDYCSTARIVSTFPYHGEGTTAGMTSQCGTAAPDVFYRFYLPAAGDLLFTVCTSTFDARVQLMGLCCGDFLDDADTGCNRGAVLYCVNLPPREYVLMIEGTSATERGSFTLDIGASLPDCPAPFPITLGTVGGYPFLDWPEMAGPSYYIVWQTPSWNSPPEHIGTTFLTFFVDSTGFAGQRRFYTVTAVCPW